jgi:hypothetical protein
MGEAEECIWNFGGKARTKGRRRPRWEENIKWVKER